MRDAQWSLILFTLLTQLAVGLFVITGAVNALSLSRTNSLAAREIFIKILAAVIIVLVLALLISVLHIGKPRNALLAASHFSRSWLSREIVSVLLFALLAAASFVLHRLPAGSQLLRERFTLVTGLIGIVAVFSMARVYMLATVPAWNTAATPVQFITTSFILGGTAYLGLLDLFGGTAASGTLFAAISKKLLPVILILVFVNLIAFLLHLHTLPETGTAGAASYTLLTERHLTLLILRLVLVITSVVLLCVLFFRNPGAAATYLPLIVCVVVFLSELIGRYLFYASYGRVGM